jgi:hypothetical protein
MPWRRAKLLVALDAASVTGAVVSWGSGGPSIGGLARVSLVPGALAPSPVETNLARLDEVREALGSVGRSLGVNGRPATLVLPEGVARTALLDVPAGLPVREYARFRLGQGLPFSPGDAVVDALPLAGRRFLCGAVRRDLVEGYETAARTAGFNVDQVNLAPLAAVSGLRPQLTAAGGGIGVILGDVAVSLAVFDRESLALFRTRRRDPGDEEGEWLLKEIRRTSALAGVAGDPPRIVVAGSGAAVVARRLAEIGCPAELAWPGTGRRPGAEGAELSWLGAALP